MTAFWITHAVCSTEHMRFIASGYSHSVWAFCLPVYWRVSYLANSVLLNSLLKLKGWAPNKQTNRLQQKATNFDVSTQPPNPSYSHLDRSNIQKVLQSGPNQAPFKWFNTKKTNKQQTNALDPSQVAISVQTTLLTHAVLILALAIYHLLDYTVLF